MSDDLVKLIELDKVEIRSVRDALLELAHAVPRLALRGVLLGPACSGCDRIQTGLGVLDLLLDLLDQVGAVPPHFGKRVKHLRSGAPVRESRRLEAVEDHRLRS